MRARWRVAKPVPSRVPPPRALTAEQSAFIHALEPAPLRAVPSSTEATSNDALEPLDAPALAAALDAPVTEATRQPVDQATRRPSTRGRKRVRAWTNGMRIN